MMVAIVRNMYFSNVIYNIILYITLKARKLLKADDGRYRPKHVVFYG